ncbi:hypothetical protein J4E89_004635 [Alternaria sp. Ai002NY15]|nr:hypothetical protein J4E89_004635 [Alternaria sp. Ai002NY15]
MTPKAYLYFIGASCGVTIVTAPLAQPTQPDRTFLDPKCVHERGQLTSCLERIDWRTRPQATTTRIKRALITALIQGTINITTVCQREGKTTIATGTNTVEVAPGIMVGHTNTTIQTSPLVVGVARLNDHPFEINVEIIAADPAVGTENEVTGLVVDAQGTETIAGDGNRRIDLVVDGETQGIDIIVGDENVRKHLVGDIKTMIEEMTEPPALSVAESEKGARNHLALPIVSPRGDGNLDNDLPARALPSMITSQGKGTGSTPGTEKFQRSHTTT